MVHGQSELRRPGLLSSRGLFDRPKRQAPAAHRQKQCVSTASLHKVHLRGRAEQGFVRAIARFLAVVCYPPFGSSGAEELSRELPCRPRCNACGGRRT